MRAANHSRGKDGGRPKRFLMTNVLYIFQNSGSHSDMTLQIWQTQLFYIFTMPLGFVFYYMMIHQITMEIFELDAYAAVTITCRKAQTSAAAWTIDQRELYEKFKVFLFALAKLTLAVYMFALLALLSGKDYIEGLYAILNMIFLVSSAQPELLSYQQIHSHGTVAFVMTVLVFTTVLLFYGTLYSLIILFRYNNLGELWDMVFNIEYDQLDDVINDDGDDDDMLLSKYRNRKWGGAGPTLSVTTKTMTQQPSATDEFWWEKEPHSYGYRRPHSPRQHHSSEEGVRIRSEGGRNVYNKQDYYLSSSTTSSSTIASEYNSTEKDAEQKQRRLMLYQKQQQQQHQKQQQQKPKRKPSLKLKMSAVGKMPSIEVTTPTPSPTEEEKKRTSPSDDFFTFAHASYKARVDNKPPHATLQD